MEPSSLQDRSIFDDPSETEAGTNQVLWSVPPEGYTPPRKEAPIKQGCLYRRRGGDEGLWSSAHYELYSSSLFLCYKKGVLKRMANLRFCRMIEIVIEKNTESSIQNTVGISEQKTTANYGKYSFVFEKQNETFDIYCESYEDFVQWRTVFRRFCILTTIHSRFNILKLIGRGSFARVYSGEDKVTKQQYAIKAFEKVKLQQSPRAKISVINEITILSNLDHPNIIKLYEVHETPNTLYCVLELVRGGEITLSSAVPEDETRGLISTLLNLLLYLHNEKRYIHRDIKPENILLKASDKLTDIKLADFGLATSLDVDEFSISKCGTPGYVAPEVFTSKKYTAAVDVYSVGIIFYRLLTGNPPYVGKDHKVILEKNKAGNIDFSPCNSKFISDEALDLLRRMLEREPENRISAEAALKHDFFLDMKVFMNVSPNTTPRISLQNLHSQENHFDMSKIKKSTLFMNTQPTPPVTDRNIPPNPPFQEVGSFYMQDTLHAVTEGEQFPNSRLQSFHDSIERLQKAAGVQIYPPIKYSLLKQQYDEKESAGTSEKNTATLKYRNTVDDGDLSQMRVLSFCRPSQPEVIVTKKGDKVVKSEKYEELAKIPFEHEPEESIASEQEKSKAGRA